MQLEVALIFGFGVVFLGLLLLLSLRFPQPTSFQYTVFRIVLALAAAGIAALIPGLLEVNAGAWLKASGALAVFAVIYFYSPAGLVANPSDAESLHFQKDLYDVWHKIHALKCGEYTERHAVEAINALGFTAKIWAANEAAREWIWREYWSSCKSLYHILRDCPIGISYLGKRTDEIIVGEIADLYTSMSAFSPKPTA